MKFKTTATFFKVEGINADDIGGIELLFYIKKKGCDTFSYESLIDFCEDMRSAIGDNKDSLETVLIFNHWDFVHIPSEAIDIRILPLRSTSNIKVPIQSITKILKKWLDLPDFLGIFNEIESFLNEHYIANEHFLEVIGCILDSMFNMLTDEEKLFLEVNNNI